MILSVDPFLSRQYDKIHYNCLHFARDVWLAHTGVDITVALNNVFDPRNRTNLRKTMEYFYRISEPIDPCLVLMHRHRLTSHIGVYLRGKVIHLSELGVEFLPLHIINLGFPILRYYLCH